MTSVVTSDKPISVSPKPSEYMTPVIDFLYTIKINSPMTRATARPRMVSRMENSVTLSKKLDLKMSLKVIGEPP